MLVCRILPSDFLKLSGHTSFNHPDQAVRRIKHRLFAMARYFVEIRKKRTISFKTNEGGNSLFFVCPRPDSQYIPICPNMSQSHIFHIRDFFEDVLLFLDCSGLKIFIPWISKSQNIQILRTI